MPDTNLHISEGAIEEQTSTVAESDIEALADTDTLEIDLLFEEELIIEDFTIDGICGVY